MENKVTYVMIRTAVKKGIQDIRENPKRGVRNLVDLGEMFATGPFQKEFFRNAAEELRNEKSTFHLFAKNVVQNVNEQVLLTFGINLGYNSWTYGAGLIRSLEKKDQFNIPWIIFFDLNQKVNLSIEMIRDTIHQGKDMGTFCYIFDAKDDYKQMEKLIALFEKETNCDFLLISSSDKINELLIHGIKTAKNIAVALRVRDFRQPEVIESIKMLQEENCLSGALIEYEELNSEAGIKKALEEAHNLDIPLLFLKDINGPLQGDQKKSKEMIDVVRSRLDVPVIPIDLWSDIANIDRNISSEGCIMVIRGDGKAEMVNPDRKEITEDEFYIQEVSLKNILEAGLPKR